MERNEKNMITTVLLVVGVIFILVAGSIFVTSAWQYLPEFAKQLILLGVSIGLFGGAHVISRNEKRKKTERAIFYLGVSFLGFFIVSVMGGMTSEYYDLQLDAFKMLVACSVMVIPVLMKLIVRKSPFEFVVLSILIDSILISGCVACKLDSAAYIYLVAGYTVVLALLDAAQQKKTWGDSPYALCVAIVYLIHAVYYCAFILGYVLGSDIEINSVVFVLGIVLISGISWKVRNETAIRICNSLAVMWFVLLLVCNLFETFFVNYDAGMVWLMAMGINSIVVLCMKRKEMIWVQAVAGLILPYIQILGYVLSAWSILDGIDKTQTFTYYPFSFVIAAAFFLLYFIENGSGNMVRDLTQNRVLKFVGLQMITGLLVWIVSKNVETCGMVFFLIGVMAMLTGASYVEQEVMKKIFKMLALFAGVFAAFYQPFIQIPKLYVAEWICFLIAIGIVLFRFIWYDEKEEFSVLYFITVCALTVVLLVHNLAEGGIGNVLILGITEIGMLIVSAVTNNRKYVALSSFTLILLVFYLTRDFWLSIAWWVYLFVAGVLLVMLAIKKEKDA